jgi:large subunit ribosomal protein L29
MKLTDRSPTPLRALTADALQQELVSLKREQFNLRFQKANGKIANPLRSRFVRRKIATLLTVLAEKKKVS